MSNHDRLLAIAAAFNGWANGDRSNPTDALTAIGAALGEPFEQDLPDHVDALNLRGWAAQGGTVTLGGEPLTPIAIVETARRCADLLDEAAAEEAERERDLYRNRSESMIRGRAEYERLWQEAESRARRAEALLGYVDKIMFPLVTLISCDDGTWTRNDTCANHDDLVSALRALKAADLLPSDVKVSE